MIPGILPEETNGGERRVFEQLRAVDVPGWDVALHSLHLPEHARKRVCELDFVIVGANGLACLEVKSGEVSRRDGVWRFGGGQRGAGRRKRDPLEQVSSAAFALEKRIGRELSGDLIRRTVVGHGLVFPDCEFPVESVEWDRQMLMDGKRIAEDGWAAWLSDFASYWAAKPGDREPISDDDVSRYLEYLRPDFDLVRNLRQLSSSVEVSLASLTVGQYAALDRTELNQRVIFHGGAGTGKTMLAAEMARRMAAAGNGVLVTCHSGVLASFIAAQPGLEQVTVRPFHHVSRERDNAFDVVVVDEAQDVINSADLASVDRVLAGGLADGRWMFLLDSNNQRGLVGSYEDVAMATLLDHRPAHFSLTDNCRNTTEIVLATRERTGADLGTTPAGHGHEVVVIEEPRSHAAESVAKVLQHLEDEDVPLDHVVLLSPHPFEQSVFASLPVEWRVRVDQLDLARLRQPTAGRVGFAAVAEFKGLESPFVIVEASSGGSPESARAALYVGMTRARAGLWLVNVIDGVDNP